MSIKRLGYVALAVAVAIGMAGCSKTEKQTEEAPAVEKKAEHPAADAAKDKPLDHPAH